MAVTFDRLEVITHWGGDDVGIDDQVTVHLWLRLASSPPEPEVVATLRHLTSRLNDERLDWNEEYELAAFSELTVPLLDCLSIGINCSTWAEAPLQYLDAFCHDLTSRGWTGHLELHHEAPRVWVPYGPEPTITTMLGFGLTHNPDDPHHPWAIWRDRADLKEQLAEIALDWIDASPGPLTYHSGITWHPTRRQAQEFVRTQLSGPADKGIEIGRLDGHPYEDRAGLRPGTRVGRTAVFESGYLILTENDAGRPLADRLRDHQSALHGSPPDATYGITTGDVGHAPPSPMAVFGQRPHLRGEKVSAAPHQRPNHSPGLPDVYYAQVFANDLLARPGIDLAQWVREDLSDSRTILTAADPTPWFVVLPATDSRRPAWRRHDADPSTLAEERASLANLLQRPEAGSAN